MPFVDVCIANEEDLSDVFGIHAGDSDIEGGSLDSEGYRETRLKSCSIVCFKHEAAAANSTALCGS